MRKWCGENDVVEVEGIDVSVCVAADGDFWVSVGSAGCPIGKFSLESEHDLAHMVNDFIENAGSFGAESWCSSDSDSSLSDFAHLAEKIQVLKSSFMLSEAESLLLQSQVWKRSGKLIEKIKRNEQDY